MSHCKTDDIQIRIVTLEDCQRVHDFMQLYYSQDEPLSSCHKPNEKRGFDESAICSYIEPVICLMAIIPETNELVGVALNSAEEPTNIELDIPKRDDSVAVKIRKFVRTIECEADLFNRYSVQKILHLSTVCVKTEMRGKNIERRLFKAVWDLGKELGFQLVKSDCSSFYSARILEGFGWDCVNTVYYRDYLDEDMKQVFSPPPPHECCKTFAVRL